MSKECEISVCLGSSCFIRNNKATLEVIKTFIETHQLNMDVFFHGDLCSGNCEKGPIVRIDDQIYEHVTPDSITSLLENHFRDELNE